MLSRVMTEVNAERLCTGSASTDQPLGRVISELNSLIVRLFSNDSFNCGQSEIEGDARTVVQMLNRATSAPEVLKQRGVR
jgi:hypothetical protein